MLRALILSRSTFVCISRNAVYSLALAAVTLAGPSGALLADERYRAEPLKGPIPEEVAKALAKPVAKTLAPVGIRVLDEKGEPYVDLWLRKHVDLQKDPGGLGIDYGFLQEGSLLGAVRFHKKTKDFRRTRFDAGVYTMRKVTQPEDGDHLGVSESRDFVLLCGAKEDVQPAPLAAKDIVKFSQNVNGSKHPTIYYLVKLFDPPKSKKPTMVEDQDLEYWVLDVTVPGAMASAKPKDPAKKDGPPTEGPPQNGGSASPKGGDKAEPKAGKPIRLGLVLVGEADE